MTVAIGLQSMLFVPGSKPDRFAKALASGADCVCIDLEDAVPAGVKAEARAAAIGAMGDQRLAIRINGLATREGLVDLLALADAAVKPKLIYIPMVESPQDMVIARRVIDDPEIAFVPLIETVKGLMDAYAIASQDRVAMVMFGGGDFSAELGVDLAWAPLLAARSQLVMACARAGVPAMDVPFIKMGDGAGLVEETRLAKELGFAAKAAIHPDQIAAIHSVMRPTQSELDEARDAEQAFNQAGGAPVRFNGKMLEAPIMRRYRQILAIGEQIHA